MELLPKLFLLTALFAAACPAAAITDDDEGEQARVNPDNQARIRFFGQAVIGLEFYRNTMCYGGDAESETPSSRKMGSECTFGKSGEGQGKSGIRVSLSLTFVGTYGAKVR